MGTDPQNEGSVSISMTAPVTIAMTAPVVTSGDNMQFILPSKYDTIESAPIPTEDDVWLVELPPSNGAVHRFSGWVSDDDRIEISEKFMAHVCGSLSEHPCVDGAYKVEVLQYDAPFIPGFLRRNEVLVELTDDQVDELKDIFSRRMLR